MKHPVRPTRAQKKLLRAWGLIPENWLIERDTPDETVIVHRITGQTKTIKKKGGMTMPKKWKSKNTIPLDVIQTGLKDPDWRVRTAAMQIAKDRGIDIPPYRSIEPPELVYKKCEAGVIVAAHIPEDAKVRGRFGGKCRANKAVIVEIIGTFCGEPVGISKYDGTTCYYKGDVVEVGDFDLSNAECSTGYHFFCSKEEAEDY